jgi:hypothetical protein
VTQVFYVDVLFVAPNSLDKLVYPKCNMAVVTKGDHDQFLTDARQHEIQRNAGGTNSVGALDSFMCDRIRAAERLLRRALDQVSGPTLWGEINEFLGAAQSGYHHCTEGPYCTHGLGDSTPSGEVAK